MFGKSPCGFQKSQILVWTVLYPGLCDPGQVSWSACLGLSVLMGQNVLMGENSLSLSTCCTYGGN